MSKRLMSHVRECREAEGLTQQQLAAIVNVSRQTVSAIEKGNYVPSVALAMDLARVFKQKVEQLFFWS